MGSIERYETSAGTRYRVRWRDENHKSKEKGGFERKRDAELYEAKVTVSKAKGDYVDPADSRALVADLGAAWLAQQQHLKPSTWRGQESSWRVHVLPKWGHRRVGEIRHSEVAAWIASFSLGDKPSSASVVIRAFGVLAAILDVAVKDRRINVNPARGVKLPRKVPKRRAYLTAAQVDLLAAHSGDNSTLVLTLAYTGLRWGEAIALRISSVDALRRRLLVEENAVSVGSTIHVGTPKTHARRSVPYPKFLAELLARECEGKSRDQLLFGSGLSHLPKPQTQSGWLRRALAAATAADPDFPAISIHDLRHTAASLAISAGATPKAVQRMLGHASAAMTLDVYADLFEDDLDAVSDRLEEARARATVGDSWGKRA
ncbi:MAG: tyrosine-type recombinase/integrase [Protaetiibacter sp.]